MMLALFSTTLLDLRLAQVFFDFASGHWWGARTWWAEDLLHEGGRNVVRMLTAAAILGWWVRAAPSGMA
ncbi:MAG: hypothetical protein HC872_03300 [Gammaproteobacteria bacterium]|nr:hypothetical protein [Gammaproteobacteria bacterium]